MAKICTTIEQSKKLIELGIDINTADMHYQWYSKTESALHVGKGSKKLNADCPAWSLSALLELIHDKIYDLRNSIIGINRYNIWVPERKSPVWTETPLDAVFEMIVWLKENEMI